MPEDKKDNIDLSKILLPKKEGPSPDSAQRVNAGALFAQEQQAAQAGLPDEKSGLPAPAESSKLKAESSEIKPLQTYQHDIESLVEKKNVSVVSIAAAEQGKRAPQTAPPYATNTQPGWATYWVSGGVLVALVVAVGTYILLQPTTVPVVPLATNAPFIAVDDTTVLTADTSSVGSLGRQLDAARQSAVLSLGLMERLYVGVPADAQDSALPEMPVQTLLRGLSPFVPEQLLRTLGTQYLLGVHSYADNQAFFILSTDSYEVAYAGMLQWETSMQRDLAPLFTRTPPVHATGTTASSTPPAIVQSQFADRVVENQDARVVQNQIGDILLLWTFLDRNTIVITTNEFTLREILSRRTSASSLGLPQ